MKPATNRTATWAMIGATIAQLTLIGIIAFCDIGFDHKGRSGMDFGDLVRMLMLFGLLVVGKFVYYVSSRLWRFMWMEVCLVVMVILATVTQ